MLLAVRCRPYKRAIRLSEITWHSSLFTRPAKSFAGRVIFGEGGNHFAAPHFACITHARAGTECYDFSELVFSPPCATHGRERAPIATEYCTTSFFTPRTHQHALPDTTRQNAPLLHLSIHFTTTHSPSRPPLHTSIPACYDASTLRVVPPPPFATTRQNHPPPCGDKKKFSQSVPFQKNNYICNSVKQYC